MPASIRGLSPRSNRPDPIMLRPYLELPRAVHILCLGTFINRAGTFLIPFLTLYLTGHRGFSEFAATSTIAVVGLGSMTAAVVGGHLADQIGRRWVMLFSLVGNAGVLLVFGFLHSPWTVIPCLFVFTLLADMYRPAASAMMADLVEPERRTLSFGLLYTAINLGFGVGAVGGGFLSKRAGFQTLFYVDAATSLFYAGIIYFTIRETLGLIRAGRPAPSVVTVEDEVTYARKPIEPVESAPAPEIPFRTAMARIARDYSFLAYCAGQLCVATVFLQSMTSLPLLLHSHFNIDTEGYGRIIAANGIMIALFQIPLTAFIQRFNRAKVLLLGALATAVGFGVTEFAHTQTQFIGTVIIWTLGEMLMAPINQPIVSEMAPPELRARYFGVFGMSFSFAMTVSAPLGGWVLQQYGGPGLTRASLCVGLFGTAILAALYRRLQPRPANAIHTAAPHG